MIPQDALVSGGVMAADAVGFVCGKEEPRLDQENFLNVIRRNVDFASPVGQLLERPGAFDFFQACLMLEHLLREERSNLSVHRSSLFCLGRLRFGATNALAFPQTAIERLRWDDAGNYGRVEVNFMGLTGPGGVLPSFYTHRLMSLEIEGSRGYRNVLSDWLDLFHHRLIQLFFEAWCKYRFPVQSQRQRWSRLPEVATDPCEQEAANSGVISKAPSTILHQALHAIGGVTQQPHEHDAQAGLCREQVLGMAGLLAQRPINVANLQSVLSAALDAPVRILQFQGSWLELEQDSQNALGEQNCDLGQNTVLGERVWSRTQKMKVEVGPLDQETYRKFLPPTEGNPGILYRRLQELLKLFVGDAFLSEVCPMLEASHGAETKLMAIEEGNRLGIDSWLGHPPSQGILRDAMFAVTESPAVVISTEFQLS